MQFVFMIPSTSDLLPSCPRQTVKALNHLKENLKIIHRGKFLIFNHWPLFHLHLVTLHHRVSDCRHQTFQHSNGPAGQHQVVWLWHQWPAGGLHSQDQGCRMQALHGGEWSANVMQDQGQLASRLKLLDVFQCPIASLSIGCNWTVCSLSLVPLRLLGKCWLYSDTFPITSFFSCASLSCDTPKFIFMCGET